MSKEDTIEARLKAIERIVSGNAGFEIDSYMAGMDKKSAKMDKHHLKEASILLHKVYVLSHGGVSSCCRGSGAGLLAILKSDE